MPTKLSHPESAADRDRRSEHKRLAPVPVAPQAAPVAAPDSPGTLLHSQSHAGNSAVATMVAALERREGSRRVGAPGAAPAAPTVARLLGATANHQVNALLRDEGSSTGGGTTATTDSGSAGGGAGGGDGGTGGGTPDGGAATQTWDPTHFYEDDGLVPVTDHGQARNNLQMISLTMQKLAEWGIPLAPVMQAKADQTRDAMPEQGALSADEVSTLKTLGDASLAVYTAGMPQLTSEYFRSLSQYQEPPELEQASKDEAADALREGFHKDNDTLAKAKELFEHVHTVEENLHYLAEWGEQTLNEVKMLDAEGIMAAHYLETAESTFGHIAERAGEVVAWVAAIQGSAQAVAATAGAIAAAHDSTKTSAQQGAAGVEAGTASVSAIIGGGVLIGLEGAASLGLVWADLILPETQAALSAVEHMDEVLGAGAVQSQAEWWQDAVQSGGDAPTIPSQYLTQNWFPGGQETLNYMWAVFKGSPPDQAPAAVTKFFYDARKKMNLEHSEGDQLETTWHLFGPNEVDNLKEWVVANKEEVWGMLYGSLPHP
jgi:hypothetical protein